jgi:hypothetical protein
VRLLLSPKDAGPKLNLENVETFCQEGETLLVIFADGRRRNYPHRHLWYWESDAWEPRSKPEVS